MKCTNCNFENQHDGVFCTDCGHNFVKVTYPHVCYFIRQEVNIVFRIKNPFEESITLSKLILGDTETGLENARIGRGKRDHTVKVSFNAQEIQEPDLILIFEKGGKTYSLKNPIKPFWLSPIPKIQIFSPDSAERFFFSPTIGFQKMFKIELKNDAVVKINGLLLIRDNGHDFFQGPGSPRFWAHSLPLVGSAIDLNPSKPEAIAAVDFSAVEKDDAEKEFNLSIKNEYGIDHEIFQEKTSGKIKLLYQDLVPITIGVLHATDKGFAYVADNHVFREQAKGNKDKVTLIGTHSDYVDLTNWKEKSPDDKGVEDRIARLNDKKIIFNIPIGLKRKRQLSVYQDYLTQQAGNYDLINNPCYVRITPKKGFESEDPGEEIITYKEIFTTGESSFPVKLGEELCLSDIRELNAFEISFLFPPGVANGELLFNLAVSRKDGSTDNIIDEQVYELVIRTFKPKVMKNFIAIDFGTSNTCVVGPQVIEGEIFDKEPGWYPLNYYHEISEQINTFPTLIFYSKVEGGGEPEPYIPDSLFQLKPNPFSTFKIYLPHEIAGEDYPFPEERSPLKMTVDFIEETLSNLQVYFEDRNCLENLFTKIQMVAPTGFIPEVRDKIVEEIRKRLETRYCSMVDKEEFFIDMGLDEPEAVLNYAYRKHLISFEKKPGDFELYGVYDFGGGTTDTSFILVDDKNRATLIGWGGSVAVGGNTVDRWLVKRFKMETNITDTRKAVEYELSGDNSLLKRADIGNLFHSPQFSLEVSKIKHYFKIKLNQDIDLPDDIKDAFPIKLETIFHQDDQDSNSSDVLHGHILTIVRMLCNEDSKIEFWNKWSNVAIHMLIPFYISFYRKIADIVCETLKDSFANNDLIAGSPRKVNINLLLAGNAARIGYIKVLIHDILKKAKTTYAFIGKINVDLIDDPKEAVGMGAYYATNYGPMPIEKINDPPMTIFIEVPPLFGGNESLLETIGEKQAIVIFKIGEKNKNPEYGGVLVKIFKFGQLGFNPRMPQIPIFKKIGIDIFPPIYQKIKGAQKGDKLAFVLTKSNRLEVFRFSNSQELLDTGDFKDMISDGNIDYIEAQIKKSDSTI